jgi:exonuclease VII large subunit
LDEVLDGLLAQELRLSRTIRAKVELGGTRLAGLLKREPLRDAMIVVRRREQVLDELTNRAQRSLATRIHGVRRTLDAIEPVIQRIAPHTYLLRTGVILRDAEHGLRWAMSRRLAGWTASLAGCDGRLDRTSPAHRVQQLREHVAQLRTSIPTAIGHRLTLLTERVRSQETLLAAVSHKNVLARGFSITRLKKGRKILRSVAELKDRQRLVTQLADGEFESETMNINQLELFE